MASHLTWPLPNVWLGTSIETQATADERIPHLLKCPAAVRFLSCEPLLSDLTLYPYIGPHCHCYPYSEPQPCDEYCETGKCPRTPSRISWCIVGGESGPNARPTDVAWIRSIVAQCKAAGVACFVKQLGARTVDRNGDGDLKPGVVDMDENMRRAIRDPKGGDWSEWPEDLRVRELPAKGREA